MLNRNATPREAPCFARLASSAIQVSERLSRLLADQTYAARACALDGSIVGFAAGHLVFPIENDTPAAQPIALVTAEHVRGQGVGSALGREFEDWAMPRGASRAIVNPAASVEVPTLATRVRATPRLACNSASGFQATTGEPHHRHVR